jgi:hypothetical protein
MINIKLSKLEKNLGLKLKKNIFVLGLDTASTTGICKLWIGKDKVRIETSIMKIPSLPNDTEDKSEKYEEALEMLLRMVRDMQKKLPKGDILVLENSFLSFSPWTYGYLKGFMGIIYAVLFDNFKEIKIIFPTSARKKVGFQSKLKRGTKSKEKKQEIMTWVSNVIGKEITEDNEADAVVLALAGSIK